MASLQYDATIVLTCTDATEVNGWLERFSTDPVVVSATSDGLQVTASVSISGQASL